MADAAEPSSAVPSSATPDDGQSAPEPAADGGEFEVEAHLAGPLDLQGMDVKTSVTAPVPTSLSATSVIVCC
ncbi:hypothetical protein [Streptomyces sp. NBC_00448]|uniref:hypothetical protein n=1 Tax=Streptomyces sp. NBC_00448 TaxID=2903652 RepID=UPI002E1A203C